VARRITGKANGDPNTAGPGNKVKGDYRPSRDEILRYITENPDRAGKRDIAKAFALRGDDRLWLKDMLRDLQDEGVLSKERKRLARVGALPPVAILDIFGRDGDGILLASPAETVGPGEPPVVSIRVSRSGNAPAPGVGDRVLAKTFPTHEETGPAYTGRVMKIFEKRTDAVLGVFRILQDGTFRIEPVERRQPELVVDKEFQNGARNGDLVEVEPARASRFGLPRAKVLNVLGSLTSEKAVSMIAIHAHDIPHIFPADVIAEAESVKQATMDHREDWRDVPLVTIDPADAKDHDDAVFATPDGDEKNPGGVIITVAIADVAAYVRYGTALDREALKRGNSVYFPDRVVPMLPERISNDLCSLREGQDRPALAVRMIFSAEGRKIRHSFHRIMMRSAAKLAYPQAQAAIDGMPDDRTGPILDAVLKPLWDAYAILKRGAMAASRSNSTCPSARSC
jgi:ribonuclease R